MKHFSYGTVILMLANLAALGHAADIDGTWELVNIAYITPEGSDPRGSQNNKMHYDGSGNVYFYGPDETLAQAKAKASYSISEGVRTIDDGTGSVFKTPYVIGPDGLLSLNFSEANVWTYRRIEGPDVILPMKSVAVIRHADPKLNLNSTQVRYDQADYSQLDLGQRIPGVWEVVSYAGIRGPDMPPYGFRNEKFVLKADGSFQRLEPWITTTEGAKVQSWSYAGGQLTLGVHPGNQIEPNMPKSKTYVYDIGFDKSGNLILSSKSVSIRLSLLSRDTAQIPLIPTKIALLNREKISLPEK